jgi:DNA invertase Pin-like site-specific DNA recombinase
VLARLLHDIAAGETLVIVRFDRLARSVSHLLSVIEQLKRAARVSAVCAIRSTPHDRTGDVLALDAAGR